LASSSRYAAKSDSVERRLTIRGPPMQLLSGAAVVEDMCEAMALGRTRGELAAYAISESFTPASLGRSPEQLRVVDHRAMEPVRQEVDGFVLDMIERRTFRKIEFTETSDAHVRAALAAHPRAGQDYAKVDQVVRPDRRARRPRLR
jgi:hypothetical protein